MKKRILIILGSITIFYGIIFAVVLSMTLILPSRIYNDERFLVKELNTANKKNFKKNKQDEITTITCEKMTGMDIIWKYNALEDITMQMNYSLQVASGKAKLILIQPDNTIITLIEQENISMNNQQIDPSMMEQSSKLDLKKGQNKIKIVCEKETAFFLSFQISK